MLRYEYRNTFSRIVKSCRDCLNYDTCDNYTMKTKNELGPCMDARFEYKHPKVTNENASWVLFQIQREVMLSKNVANSIIQEHRLNWQAAETLQSDLSSRPTVTECCGLRIAMEATGQFLRDKRNEVSSTILGKSDFLRSFVISFIDTYIEVEGKTVKVYSHNWPFIEYLEKAVEKENYTLYKITKSKENNNGNNKRKKVKKVKKVA